MACSFAAPLTNAKLQDTVIATLAEMHFHVGVQEGFDSNFVDLGMDFLDIGRLAKKLVAKLGKGLTMDQLLECASVGRLVERLQASHGDQFQTEVGAVHSHVALRPDEVLMAVRGAMVDSGFALAADASCTFLESGVDDSGLLKLCQNLNTRLGLHIPRSEVMGCRSPQDLVDCIDAALAVAQARAVEPHTRAPSFLGTIEVVMASLGYHVDRDNRGQTFSERGMDFLDLLRLRKGVSAKIGVELARDLPLECQSAETMAERLASDSRCVQVVQHLHPSKMAETPLDAIRSALIECGHAASGVSNDVHFVDLGLDTLEFSRVRRRLASLLAMDLPPTLLFDFPSVGALARHLDKRTKQVAVFDEAPQRPALWNTVYGGRTEKVDVRRAAQGFDAVDSQELIEIQDGLLEVLQRPEVRGRIQETVRRCYPDKFRYIVEVDELLKDVEGSFLLRWGLARSTAAQDVRLARAGLQRCVAKFWR
eukprot:CAMPEP_0117571992 /NCGR_PEP_ID=MMETSP0784-20121206/60078_1 /TAXON_ID=39447 /ORGANISM="" /LENGTH=479 /DNA_ID=CAMNT_0005370251 /DNA_START=71 /DNA_END=1506 /DNA_ORIENTATION=-